MGVGEIPRRSQRGNRENFFIIFNQNPPLLGFVIIGAANSAPTLPIGILILLQPFRSFGVGTLGIEKDNLSLKWFLLL